MWAFLLSPLGRLIGIGALSAAIAAFGSYEFTAALKDRTIDQMKLADSLAVTKAWQAGWALKEAADKVTHDADVAYAQKQQKTVTVTVENIRKVPVYVNAKDDARCHLNLGFVRVLDATALGITPEELPNRSAEPDSADSGIPLSSASALLAQALGDRKSFADRLANARDAWAAQAAVK